MSLSNLWKPDKIELGGTLVFEQFETQGMDPGIQEILARPAGHPHPMVIGSELQQPIIEFATPQIDVVANIPVGGVAYTGDSYLYFKQGVAGGTTDRTTGSHARLVASSVMVHWTTITLPNRGQGIANVVVSVPYDGVNDPLVYAGGVSLSGNLGSEKQYGCGPASITTGSTINLEPDEIVLTSGVELHKEGCASELWDTFVGLKMTEPMIEVASKSKLAINNFGLSGAIMTAFAGYARQTAPRVSNAAESHITITAGDGVVFPGRASTADGLWTDRVRIRPVPEDDSSEPFTFSGGQAIS